MTKILSEKSIKNFDENRLAKAVERIAKMNRVPAGDAENISRNVIAKLESWLGDKPEITARELRVATAHVLANYDADAAYLYENENKLF